MKTVARTRVVGLVLMKESRFWKEVNGSPQGNTGGSNVEVWEFRKEMMPELCLAGWKKVGRTFQTGGSIQAKS